MPLLESFATSFASDRQQESFEERAAFAKVRRAENDYGRRLRQVAKHIEDMVRAFAAPDVDMDLAHLEQLLHRYSNLIEPWARAVATRFVAEVSRRDEQAWQRLSKKMSRELAREVLTAPTGFAMRQFLETQVQLITSLPTKAAERVHELAIGNLYAGERYGSLVEHLMETGRVTRSRATMIARTETARVSSSLTMARAQHVGSEFGIWRTVRDGRVRESHRKMEGTVFRWDDPPQVEPGKFYLPGQIYNCFTGDTPVGAKNGVRRVWRAWHDGELVGLRFNDETIWATPNHPILTWRGWVAASALNHSDYIITEPCNIIGGVDSEHYQVPATFEDIFLALSEAPRIILPGAEFYGEVFCGDVDQINVARALVDRPIAIRPEKIDKLSFTDPEMSMVDANSGCLDHIALPSRAGSAYLASLIKGPSGSGAAISRACIAQYNAMPLEMVGNDVIGGIVSCAYDSEPKAFVDISFYDFGHREIGPSSLARASAMVRLDSSLFEPELQRSARQAGCGHGVLDHSSSLNNSLRLVDKLTRRFSGHVYTLESDTGYYSVGKSGAIAKNCRCYPEPIIADRFLASRMPA